MGLLAGAALAACAPRPPSPQPPSPQPTAPQPAGEEPVDTEGVAPEKGHEALHFQRMAGGLVRCDICWRGCIVAPGERGFCGTRENRDGTLYTLLYHRASAVNTDPVEKLPAYHVLPGTNRVCIGTAGCNYRCLFCHNWPLSQRPLEEVEPLDYTVEDLVRLAIATGCPSVSFTYNEPTVFYEFMLDTARRAHELGLLALSHSNGSASDVAWRELLPHLDAVTVDLKAFCEKFYAQVSAAELAPVLRALERIRASGTHLEIVNLVIPTLNDDPDDLQAMCRWIAETLGDDVPLHFTRFLPAYRLERLPATPIETLERAAAIADAESIQFVYIGNVPGHRRNSTYCPKCDATLVTRMHFEVLEYRLIDGRCPDCGHALPGIWGRQRALSS